MTRAQHDCQAFMSELFRDQPDGTWIAISQAPKWSEPRYLASPNGAGYYAVGKRDVYVRITLLRGQPRGRGKAADSAVLPAIWAELDVNGGPTANGGVVTDGAPTLQTTLPAACLSRR